MARKISYGQLKQFHNLKSRRTSKKKILSLKIQNIKMILYPQEIAFLKVKTAICLQKKIIKQIKIQQLICTQ